ncbi:MAG: 3'-5' exonuclease [Myxococcota bacterium]
MALLDSLIVVDVEATCWDLAGNAALASNQRNECEIIEIGAVRYPPDDRPPFQGIVKPRRHPTLSDFCIQLTGITQDEVDGGRSFPEVYADFLVWCGPPGGVVGSWGSFDHRQFARDCRRYELPLPPWQPLNLKRWFARIARKRGAPRRGWMSLANALAYAGLAFEGTPHRALTDATNTGRLVDWANRAVLEATETPTERYSSRS